MKSMVEILSHHADIQPSRIFAADASGGEYSYAVAWEAVQNVASNLVARHNVTTDECVMVECSQTADYLIVDLACELVGAVFVPIEKGASEERKKDICDETESVLWIYVNRELEFVKSVRMNDLFSKCESPESFKYPDENKIAEILYTTGTTGTSKGIAISNRANVALAENIKYGVNMKPDNTELLPLPISHSHGLRCCYANLLNGGAIILTDGLMKVKDVFRLAEKYSVTSMDLSPGAVSLLIELSKGAFWEYGRKLDYIQIGTAVLPETLKEQLQDELPGVHLYNFYGSTESGRSCVLDFSVDKGLKNCVGKPTKNSVIAFTDDNRNFVEATEENPGLLASKGAMNMDFYWNNPKLTSEAGRDGYVFTNDCGYMDETGYVYVLGRQGDVINYNGIKISPDEIEEVAKKYDEIIDAACVPIDDKIAGQIPWLFVEVKNKDTFDMKTFTEYMSDNVDSAKVPKRVELIDSIPRTYNGKLQRGKLINERK